MQKSQKRAAELIEAFETLNRAKKVKLSTPYIQDQHGEKWVYTQGYPGEKKEVYIQGLQGYDTKNSIVWKP